MANNKLVLRVTLKLLSGAAILWLLYIFSAGIFNTTENAQTTQHTFDLSTLSANSATYFKVNNRELLVIKTQNKQFIFWAQDPVYGCRLEYLQNTIKPICIDIEYNLDGYSTEENQQLSLPEYEITSQQLLQIY